MEKRSNFISFILKRRRKIILETGSIIRILGRRNSVPAEFPGGGGQGVMGRKESSGSRPSREKGCFLFNSLTPILLSHPCLKGGLFNSHQQCPGGRNPGFYVKELNKKYPFSLEDLDPLF